jgi:hypothetical protein
MTTTATVPTSTDTWETVLQIVVSDQKYLSAGASLIVTIIKVYEDIHNGKKETPLQLIEALAPDVLPLLGLVAETMFPAETTLIQAIVVVAQLLTLESKMTPQQKTQLLATVQGPHLLTVDSQKAWYDRQNATE